MNKVLYFLIIFLSPILLFGQEFISNNKNFDKNKPLNITSQKVIIYRDKEEINFINKVIAKQDNFTLKADKMVVKYFKNKNNKTEIKNITATNNVKFTTDDIVATSNNGYYNTKNNTITLKNNVEIIENGITLIADEFKYFILTGETKIIGNQEKEERVTIILDTDKNKLYN